MSDEEFEPFNFDETEDPKEEDKPAKFKGAQNPPADQNPDVVKAKAKVNPQAVGAILGNSPAVSKPPSPQEIEEGAMDDYAKNLAPVEGEDPKVGLKGDEPDPETGATEDTRSDAEKAEDN